ncbi:Gfo/Idh/MocA family oxidoreductase [Phaeobacter inhibens]|uniref:Gfo/Idh/MocA family protein n=1 Tax=Phaeobacter inhibens TaxID=221822 RepID=UPI0021A4CD67|nr:Gfo/Idh/MocA family oxidoreductase [Phaeobacter inhibens]UWR63859.1 Gfo/Idh/MocA family oxidoreductase [Phaeobacter inhibens]
MTLKWAIIGTGFISNKAIDGIKKSDGSQLHSVFGRQPNLVAEFQARHDIPHGLTDLDAVLSDPELDAIYIGLPNHMHHVVTTKAAQAGLAVLSEKSLTTTMAEADALLGAVADAGTFFVEGLMYLAHPLLARFVEVLQDGRLGALRSINGYYCADIWQFVNPKGMGTLYNLGCYPASLLQLTVQTMCGEDAFGQRKLHGFGNLNDDGTVCDAACSVRFENGVLATLHSTDSYGTGNAFTVIGDNGILSFETNPWQPIEGRSTLKWSPFDGTEELIHVEDPHDAFYHQTKLVEHHVARSDREAARPSPRHRDSWEIMEFLTNWEASCRAALTD